MFAATRVAARQGARQHQQVRRMGAHAAPKYEGLEAKIREVLPEDHHIVLAHLGAFAGMFILYKATRSKKPAAVEEAAAPSAAAATGAATDVPSILDESFEAWSAVPGNLAKYETALEEWATKL